jgi:hypothetical protein
MHSDPHFPDCAPGQTVAAHGRLFFFEGKDIREEIKRLRKGNKLYGKPRAGGKAGRLE